MDQSLIGTPFPHCSHMQFPKDQKVHHPKGQTAPGLLLEGLCWPFFFWSSSFAWHCYLSQTLYTSKVLGNTQRTIVQLQPRNSSDTGLQQLFDDTNPWRTSSLWQPSTSQALLVVSLQHDLHGACQSKIPVGASAPSALLPPVGSTKALQTAPLADDTSSFW